MIIFSDNLTNPRKIEQSTHISAILHEIYPILFDMMRTRHHMSGSASYLIFSCDSEICSILYPLSQTHVKRFLLQRSHQSRKYTLEQTQDAGENQDGNACHKTAERPAADRIRDIDMEESGNCPETGVIRE